MTAFRSCLYDGAVMHARLRPFRHRFRYAVYSLLLDLDELADISTRLGLLRIDRPGLLSFWQKDHGPGDGRALRPWVEGLLRDNGLAGDLGSVRLLCFPRVLGYAFNPLSIFYCEDVAGRLRAVVYQVNNTFGERHFYLYPVDDPHTVGPFRHSCEKAFYVSPFIGMQSTYHFRITPPEEKLNVLIRQTVPEGDQLVAILSGRRRPLTDANLATLALKVPLAGFKVIAAIHWQALRLWLKGARYQPRPGAAESAPRPQTTQ